MGPSLRVGRTAQGGLFPFRLTSGAPSLSGQLRVPVCWALRLRTFVSRGTWTAGPTRSTRAGSRAACFVPRTCLRKPAPPSGGPMSSDGTGGIGKALWTLAVTSQCRINVALSSQHCSHPRGSLNICRGLAPYLRMAATALSLREAFRCRRYRLAAKASLHHARYD
jgi:hypothetical protein